MIYGDARPPNKAKFLAELSRVFQDSVNPILIGWDFNIIKNASNKRKPGMQGHRSFLSNAILEQDRVREFEMHGRKFTWGNNLPQPTLGKVDRILCTMEWEGNYPLTEVPPDQKEI